MDQSIEKEAEGLKHRIGVCLERTSGTYPVADGDCR